MAFADPHIGVQDGFVQAVAVGGLLGAEHDVAQGIAVQELLLPALEDLPLEAEPGIDVADDLGGIGQLGFDQRQLLRVICRVANGGSHDHALIEGGGGLGHGHGVVLVQGAVGADVLIVEGVAQLMGQGHHVAHLAVEVGQNPAFA